MSAQATPMVAMQKSIDWQELKSESDYSLTLIYANRLLRQFHHTPYDYDGSHFDVRAVSQRTISATSRLLSSLSVGSGRATTFEQMRDLWAVKREKRMYKEQLQELDEIWDIAQRKVEEDRAGVNLTRYPDHMHARQEVEDAEDNLGEAEKELVKAQKRYEVSKEELEEAKTTLEKLVIGDEAAALKKHFHKGYGLDIEDYLEDCKEYNQNEIDTILRSSEPSPCRQDWADVCSERRYQRELEELKANVKTLREIARRKVDEDRAMRNMALYPDHYDARKEVEAMEEDLAVANKNVQEAKQKLERAREEYDEDKAKVKKAKLALAC